MTVHSNKQFMCSYSRGSSPTSKGISLKYVQIPGRAGTWAGTGAPGRAGAGALTGAGTWCRTRALTGTLTGVN
jgi:hypothetical protein